MAGTVFSGTVRIGDAVVIFPAGISVRVRSIHSQNRPAEIGNSGERCALNVSGVEKSAVKRGDWVADSRALLPSTRIDVRIELLPDINTVLKAWASIHFHHGAAHLTAHVVPLEGATVSQGDHVTPRSYSKRPSARCPAIDSSCATRRRFTHGGGVVLDPFAHPASGARRTTALLAGPGANVATDLASLLAEAPFGVKSPSSFGSRGARANASPTDAMPLMAHESDMFCLRLRGATFVSERQCASPSFM